MLSFVTLQIEIVVCTMQDSIYTLATSGLEALLLFFCFVYLVICKNLPAVKETQFLSPGWEDPLEKEMATHSSILAWRIPWTEESGGLKFIGSKRVGHICATNLHFHFHAHNTGS